MIFILFFLVFNDYFYGENIHSMITGRTISFVGCALAALINQQMGVGGDNSWGAPVYPEYLLREREYRYAFKIIPVSNLKIPR